MTGPKYPAIGPKGALGIPGNDSRHNLRDPNMGGGPQGMNRNGKQVPINQRGGMGQHGQRPYVRASMGGGRATAGNPAHRGGTPGSFHAEQRISGHGGSPQMDQGAIAWQGRGGFTADGQKGLPSGSHSDPPMMAGNTSGRSHQLIAGRFNRKAMGAKATGDSGKYGSPPVTSNT